MDIVLKADKNVCEITGWQSNTGEVNVRTLTVEMCEEMCSCAMAFVTFKLHDGSIYESLVTDGKANIPTIDEDQFIEVGVYSANIEGDKCVKRYSPHPTTVHVNAGSYSGKSVKPPVITPTDYEKLVELIKNSGGGITEITKDTYINELESGIYRCKAENGVALYFNANTEYGLVDGIVIVSHLELGSCQWLAIGTDPAYFETTRLGTSVIDEYGTLVVDSVRDLNSTVTTEDVLQSINQSTNNPPRAMYSANVLNKDIIIPVTQTLNQLANGLGSKEDKSNKTNEIQGDRASTELYATEKAVFDFGLVILAKVEEMLENVNVNASQLTAEAITTFTMETKAYEEVMENA